MLGIASGYPQVRRNSDRFSLGKFLIECVLEAELRQFKLILSLTTSIAAIVMGNAAVSAANLAPRMYTKAPAPMVAAYNWTGFYIGGFVGGAFADGSSFSTDPRNAAGTFYNGPLNNSYNLSDSVIGGGTIGYNYQPIGSIWLFGLEGEAGYIHLSKSVQDVNAINDGFAYPDSLDSNRIGD